MTRRLAPDLLPLALLLVLPLLLFWAVTVGSETLVPAENLFQWAPWSANAAEHGATVPQNELLSDLLLENYAWKRFLRQSIQDRQIPLWNPYLFAGTPFLATGQHSILYPFSLIFMILPLTRAFGVFTVSQLFLAGASMYLLARILHTSRLGATLSAVVYQLCSYMLVSVTFPMILAGSAWLPFLLAMIELTFRQRPLVGKRPATLPWVLLGSLGLGMQILAGHGENTYFALTVMGLFSAWRLGQLAVSTPRVGRWKLLAQRAGWLVFLVVLGVGLGSVQFIPFVELVQHNFREGAASLSDVLSWSYPWRRLVTFLAPNFFGNPSHHAYLDLFSHQLQAITVNAHGDSIFKIDWGIKNYVEGGAYLGVLPVLLAGVALASSFGRRADRKRRVTIWFFALLAAGSLSLIFRTGAYAVIHLIPIINQSHSPFRWVYPLSLAISVLAGIGADHLARGVRGYDRPWWERALPWITGLCGVLGLAGLLGARLAFDQIESWVDQAFWALAKAPEAFPNSRAFFSYEAVQLGIACLFLIGAGVVMLMAFRARTRRHRQVWGATAIGFIALDLALAVWGFHPTADPALLDVKPELIRYLEAQPGLWRLTTFTPHGDKPLNANAPWLYDLFDARGYDSIISKQYVDYMRAIEPQNELLQNRIQPIVNWQSLNSPLLDLLGVRFIISSETLDLPKLAQVWQGENLIIYENLAVAPRAFTLPLTATLVTDDPFSTMGQFDPRSWVILAREDISTPSDLDALTAAPSSLLPAQVSQYGTQEVSVRAQVDESSWLVLCDSFFPGWKAFSRPAGCEDCDESELEVVRVDGNFRAVRLNSGTWSVRFKYSPMSFKLSLFGSFMAAVTILFLGGVWLWRLAYREEDTASAVHLVAKNSLAPMALNLLNKVIDFAYAMLMLRILGAENAGRYYLAINIAGWFEILGSFGLHTLMMREVARQRSAGNRYLVNTTLLRLLTSAGAAVPIALYILLLATGTNPLAADTTQAIWLLILGMIPGGVSTGLTALFYSYEKAEIPAAFTTVSTILKVSLGTMALLLGYGFVGLALVSIVVNLVTMLLLLFIAARTFFLPRWELDWGLQKGMLHQSFPLMLNHLLATLFFKVDVLLLERIGGTATASGNTVVGWFSTAYKWLDALNVIPAFFTLSIFPVLSRQAQEPRQTMLRTYALAIKLLTMISLPVAVLTTGLAHPLIQVLGGAEYLPHGAYALQIMIWSIPIGWINSITNYVLIALDQQRMLTRAFAVGVGFNLFANAIFLPRFGYPAAAVIAILSELALLIAFYRYLCSALAPIPWLQLLWRPAAAAALMGAITWLGWQAHPILGLAAGIATYLTCLVRFSMLTRSERELLSRLLPERVHQLWARLPQRLRSPLRGPGG